MPDPKPDLLAELKRRNVFRVAAMYAVVAWLVVQIADATFEVLGISEDVHRVLILVAAAGFPVAVMLGWIYDWTADGLVRTSSEAAASERPPRRRWVDLAILGGLALAVGGSLWVGLPNGTGFAGDRRASIVVLPFDDLSARSDQEYFAHGMSEELINVIGKLPTLRVIGRTSAEAAKREGMTVERIGTELGADAVVEGSVRRSSDRIRISVHLLGTDEGGRLWSETYDRPVDDVFELQAQIAADVAAALDLRLKAAASDPPTTSLEAYDAYLTGRHLMGRQTRAAMAAAGEHFEQAVRADPDFALAWSGLSDVSSLSWAIGFDRSPSLVERAFEAADRAVTVAPDSAEALTSLARTQWMRREWRASEASLQKAIELNPGYGFAYQSLALVLVNLGEFEDGLAASHRSVDLEPLSPYMYVNLATSYDAARDHESAVRYARRALELEPGNPVARGIATMNLMYLGRGEEAIEQMTTDDPTGELAVNREIYEAEGVTGIWRSMLDWWTERGFACGGPAGPLFYAQLGNREAALACLEGGVEIPGAYANVYIAQSVALDPVREEPRFRQVLADMGLPH